ncbi:MAG TPA: glycosyltransferase [Thermoanaerobaculia bacterium]|nr:glycosyltransferase [Thermoanaerobaculia bacterium]
MVPTLGAPSLAAALASVRRQGATVHIVVVYQGAAPVPEAAATFADQVLSFPRPLGFAAAVNAGLAAVEAPLLLLLNDDAELLPGWLPVLLDALAADARLAAVQGVDLASHDGAVSGCGLAWNRWWQAVQLGAGGRAPAGGTREVFGVSAAAALFRRASLAAAALPGGAFEGALETYYEDVELAARLRRAGSRAALVPAARALHAGGGSADALGGRRLRLVYANRWLALARLLGGAFAAQAPRALLRDVADTARQPARMGAVIGGWARAVRLLPRFARRGAPLVSRGELRRLAAERFAV